MLDVFLKMFCGRASRQRHPRQRRPQRLSQQVQACEVRLLLSAVDVTTTPGPAGSVKVTFDGTDADDQVLLGAHYQTGLLTAYSFNGTTFRLNGGPEVNELVFTSISDVTFNLNGGSDVASVFTTSLRDVNFNLGSGDDSAFIVDVNARDVTIHDGAGDFEQNGYYIQTFASSFDLRNIEAEFDRGISQVNVQAFSGHTIELGKVTISGQNVQNVGFSANADADSHILITGDVKLDVDPAFFGVASLSLGTQQSFSGNPGTVVLRKDIELRAPGGTMAVNGNTSVHGKTDFITTGFSSDRVNVDSGAPVFEGKVTINTGEGDDFILMEKFDPLAPAAEFHAKVDISTGGGNDIVNIGPAIIEGALTVDLGTSSPSGPFGVDNMRLGAVDIGGKLDVVTLGEAVVIVDPPATGEARFRKDASFTLGAGRVFIESSDSNVIFDKKQIFVGDPNRIQVHYIGNVTADLTKRKLINADLFTA